MIFVERVTDYMQNGETIGECYNRLMNEEIDDPLESLKFSWVIGDWEKELRKADGINGLFLEWEEIFGEAVTITNGLFTNVTSNLLFAYIEVMDERRSSSSLEMIYNRILNVMQENENIRTTAERVRLEEEEADHGFLIDVFDLASVMGCPLTSRKVQGLNKIELKMHLQLLIQCKLEQG
ncbi:hypothetical protein CASFOL_020838 [Castilleja foliolosa]|uniref:Uncharacterized protein n=1 Tax=Castilleja foliolosa TaxID=1961234 RepID=A0ABD3D1Z4_9LAMI